MNIKLRFLGAAQNVTGSCYFVEANGVRVLVDCGLYQEREYRERNWQPFPVPPHTLDAILLTHAHLDHCGLLPKLAREGFHGPVYCTAATAEIAQIMLMDAAQIQQEDADFKRKRHGREGRTGPYPEVPLYTTEDVMACLSLFSAVAYRKPVEAGDGVTATFYDAGHVLGSAMVELVVRENGDTRRLLFSGDVGRWHRLILRDPTVFQQADYVVVESTYGDRLHDPESPSGKLADVIQETVQRRGNLVVPSFALERSQELLYGLNLLLKEGRIPHILVFLDSPTAASITEVFERHAELYDDETMALLSQGRDPFDFPGLTVVRTPSQSKAINNIAGSAMIIAGSGMCTGGRIKHHLVRNIHRPESTILFVGYQAAGTLGRQIIDGAREVRILGLEYPVRARIEMIEGFSGHADRDELFRWLSALRTPPTRVFVVHGEPATALRFAEFVAKRTGWKTSVPAYGEEVTLE
jgi:metallo-beta-lactamase family protein